jgi:hypothetical protein
MKKSIINRNYSLLVLILLILFITYINIPLSTSMKGGSVGTTKYDSMSKDKLTEELMKTSTLFMVLNKYLYVYIGIIVILLGVAIYYLNDLSIVQGIPGIKDPVLGWDNEGVTFLTQYFILDRENKGLNNPGSARIPEGALDNFDKNVTDVISNYRQGVDLFCNVVAPCSICDCSGPDPKYGGDPANAPIIPYGGTECKPNVSHFTSFVDGKLVEHLAPPTSPAEQINATKWKLDFSHRKMGNIPKCCCHLLNAVGINIASVTDSMANLLTPAGSDKQPVTGNELTPILALSDQSKAYVPNVRAIRNTTFPIGIYPELGCEPAEEPAPLNTPAGSVKPNNGNYALAMFQACLSKKPITYKGNDVKNDDGSVGESNPPPPDSTTPNSGKTPLEVNKVSCATYDTQLSLDRGYSKNSLYRNNDFFNALKNIIAQAKKGTPVTSFDIKPYIGVLPTPSNSSKPWSGPAWPSTHAAFSGDSTTTLYFYNSAVTSKKYELKIDNYLKEVYAYPVAGTTPRNPYCTVEILAADTGGANAIAFLDAGIIDKYVNKSSKLYRGTYIFP